MIIKYATLAQKTKTELFSIECELQNTNNYNHEWRKLIKNVRGVYKGLVTASANYGYEETSKSWWDSVDIIGVDFYPSLSYINYSYNK